MGTTEKRIKAERENAEKFGNILKENSSSSDDIQNKILKWSRITAITITLTLILELSPYAIKMIKWIFSFF
ncbi:MAG: hypothetical protein QT05_C0025G0005 [archaeon GW2011_AR13]|nr:MAG: hypothetical protein QT05_C0025G0005 [archaeon GW2011_AR13]HIG94459.1 hypothetical protein [Nanoarchaeota archaeon]HIH62969.1 hypothetical protein [Nanoarchaeota archaeon]HIJ10234.1 hypothetical protein [Nanoarchaeota archaeon]